VGSYAGQFNGSNDYVELGNNLEWPDALSVVFWHKRTVKDTVNADGIIGNWFWNPDPQLHRGWVLRYFINTDYLGFTVDLINGSTIEERATAAITEMGTWQHVAAVFDPMDRTLKLYINGVLQGVDTAPSGFNQIAHNSSFSMKSGYNPVNEGYFTGLIDDVRIYNRALSAAEIQAIYDAK
jgi:hypothetical protein